MLPPLRCPRLVCLPGLLGLVLFAGCATERVLSPDDYRARLPALEARAAAHAGDADAQRDLGEAYAQTDQFARAREALGRAEALRPGDPKTLYYLGVSEEGLGRPDAALALYDRYDEASPRSPYRQLLEGRRGWLLREIIRDELSALLREEATLTADSVTEAVAVFPLAYQGRDSTYAPLGRGLAEMLTVDLAATGAVRVVERVRLQALLDELALSSGAAFDAATAPRLGRLLRSGRVVGGALDVREEQLRTDVALWAWPSEPLPDLTTHQDALSRLFAIEKEIVFALLDQLGITLTAEVRAEVERVPTRNLLAFLAYSRGLLEEDAGRYAEAAALYAEAVRADPGFREAARRRDQAASLATVAGGVDAALFAARWLSSAYLGAGLVGDRLLHLHEQLGVHVVPGEEAREPTAEVPLGPPTATPIPDPPPPPPSGGG